MKYVNVIIDNKSNSTDSMFTYACPFDDVTVGCKVNVPFARLKKPKAGYIVSVLDGTSEIDPDIVSKLKDVAEIDREESLNPEMIRTSMWMKGRYLCRYIDAIKCFAPAGKAPKRRKEQNSVKDCEPAEIVTDLTEEQRNAMQLISDSIRSGEHHRFLIHGVTGSGKTEVYIRAAREALDTGRSVIVLVPEISLTNQIIERFVTHFTEKEVALLHSRLSSGERYDQWRRIKSGEARIVIGARSACFAPAENIGLIVVDEEHESTYKSDFTPKYDTVEVALKRLADKDNKGVLILGSATPSVATYERAKEGIYRLITMEKRYNSVALPETEIVDMRREIKAGNRNIISDRLASEMRAQLSEGKQIMLFLNRRGYSTFVSCRECGYISTCPNCGLSLTYHRAGAGRGLMTCHYCGHEEPAPESCPECGSRYIRYFGSGTEKLQEAVTEMFPGFAVERVDLDSVKEKGELKKKLRDFSKGKTSILIGTQLIAKGLDFKNVGLAGIVSADVTLNIPDYRSPERAFQLITQAAGRAGRGDSVGKVIIQTYNPEHYALVHAARHDYRGFFAEEDRFRKYMMYPPYGDIIRIIFTSATEEGAERGARLWYDRIVVALPQEDRKFVFEPQEAYMKKISENYRFSMIIKCPKGERQRYALVIHGVQEADRAENRKKKKDYTAVVDINPYSFS